MASTPFRLFNITILATVHMCCPYHPTWPGIGMGFPTCPFLTVRALFREPVRCPWGSARFRYQSRTPR